MTMVFGGILKISTEELIGGAKINYFRSRRVGWYRWHCPEKNVSMRNPAVKIWVVHQIFGKTLTGEL